MLRLILLRHAKSDWPAGAPDHDRPLASRGRKAAAAMGRYMAGQGLRPDLALVSSAARARETWGLVRPAFAGVVPERQEKRIYEAGITALLGLVRETEDATKVLLMVGHNPGFENLARELSGTGAKVDLARLAQKYPTAGLAVIDFDLAHWSEVGKAGGRLERFATPKSIGDQAEDD
jgi:phosphohistidine phosphatase